MTDRAGRWATTQVGRYARKRDSQGTVFSRSVAVQWTATNRNATSTTTLLLEWVERLAKDMKDGRPVLKKSVPLEKPLAVGNTRS